MYNIFSKIITDDTSKYKSQIFNLGYNKENYRKIDIAKTVQENFFTNINIDIVEKDLDLRSYRLNFDKMKNFLIYHQHQI